MNKPKPLKRAVQVVALAALAILAWRLACRPPASLSVARRTSPDEETQPSPPPHPDAESAAAASIHREEGSVIKEDSRPAATRSTSAAPAGNVSPIVVFEQEPNAILRRKYLAALAESGQPDAGRVAELALNDPDPTVAMQAALLLGETQSARHTAALLGALQGQLQRPDGYGLAVCEAIVEALAKIGNPAAVPLLVAHLDRHLDLSYDRAIVRALGSIGHTSGRQPVLAFRTRLERNKPEASLALGPWHNAMSEAQEALEKIARSSRP